MNLEEYIQTDYERAKLYYNPAPPRVLGRLAIAQCDAELLPLDLGSIYSTVFETIDREPQPARQYAQTFGMVNVAVALDARPTSFRFDRVDSRRPTDTAEIVTKPQNNLSEMFRAPDNDSPVAYLLADDDGAVSTEMALIQALHMVDMAMVTRQYDGELPLIRSISNEQLLRLRSMFPDEVLLRVYGNVRRSGAAPRLLGSVIPTALLERSKALTRRFEAQTFDATEIPPDRECIRVERLPASFVGITTAKKPHIGHAFLLVKAIAEAGENGRVLVELNDNGPRVDRAMVALATAKGIPIREVTGQVSAGSIGFDDIEAAYIARSDAAQPAGELPDYRLYESNAYYRELLESIIPSATTCVAVADSELSQFVPRLTTTPGYLPLFNESGMSLLRDSSQNALVLQQKDRPTLAGILGALSTRYALRLVDSPPPLSARERGIFKEAGLEVKQSIGTGIMIDFGVASGTNGTAQSLDGLLQLVRETTDDSKLLLPASRRLLNGAYFLPSEGSSMSANFSSKEAVVNLFTESLEKVASMDDPESLLYAPMNLKDVKREMVRDILKPIYSEAGIANKPTPAQIEQVIRILPNLVGAFSAPLLRYVSSTLNKELSIPKTYIQQGDRHIFQALSSANPDTVIPLLVELAGTDRMVFDTLVVDSELEKIMLGMGYDMSDAVEFLGKVRSVKGIYRLS